MTDAQIGSGGTRRGSSAVITDAQTGSSAEMSTRVRRYTITMAFRTACFISMIFVDGPFRWVLFAGAVVLPYIAVLFANQANKRTTHDTVTRAEPIDRPQLASAPTIEVVSGTVVDGDPTGGRDDFNKAGRDRRVA